MRVRSVIPVSMKKVLVVSTEHDQVEQSRAR